MSFMQQHQKQQQQFIPQSAFRQVHSLSQTQFFTQRDLMLPI